MGLEWFRGVAERRGASGCGRVSGPAEGWRGRMKIAGWNSWTMRIAVKGGAGNGGDRNDGDDIRDARQ